jgi:hypothetical protein
LSSGRDSWSSAARTLASARAWFVCLFFFDYDEEGVDFVVGLLFKKERYFCECDDIKK